MPDLTIRVDTDGGVAIETSPCPECESVETIHTTMDRYAMYVEGMHVQDAFPDLTADQRERFVTGLCGECWDKLMLPIDDDMWIELDGD